jgi:hypothetical protein
MAAGLMIGCTSGSGTPSSTNEPSDAAPIASAEATSSAAAAGPEGLYDLGDGRMLYLECIGEGSPTIVIDVGNDDTIHGSWDAVFAPMGEVSQTCAYDRANLGRSGPDPGPRTIADMGDDLLALVEVAGVAGPYVFVGGSFGGNIVTVLAAQHPEAVAGLVLVDAEPAHLVEDNPYRLNLTDAQWDECCAGFELPPWDSPGNTEHIDYAGGFEMELSTVGAQPQVPAIVMTATQIDCPEEWPCEAIFEDVLALQGRWIEGNPLGEQVLVESGHVVQREQPGAIVEHTQTVVDQVRAQ